MDLTARFVEQARRAGRTLVFPEATEPRTLKAAERLVREKIVRPVLVGPEKEVRSAAAREGVGLDGIALADPAGHPRRAELSSGTLEMLRPKGYDEAKVAVLIATWNRGKRPIASASAAPSSGSSTTNGGSTRVMPHPLAVGPLAQVTARHSRQPPRRSRRPQRTR